MHQEDAGEAKWSEKAPKAGKKRAKGCQRGAERASQGEPKDAKTKPKETKIYAKIDAPKTRLFMDFRCEECAGI